MSRPSEPRVAPLPREEWDDAVRKALDMGFPGLAARIEAAGPDGPPVPTVLGTLVHHPELTGPFMAFNGVLLGKPKLGARWRELLVLRVAWRTRAAYEWVQHTKIGVDAGITPEEIEAIASDTLPGPFGPMELDLIAAADQLLDDHCIADETWARLAAELDVKQLFEVVFTVGTYTLVSMAFNSFGVQLDPGLEPAGTKRIAGRP